MSSSFTALGIRTELAGRLAQEGISEPTPVQETAIPVLLQGKDVIVQAQTGTGKTLAFALPALQQINPGKTYTQALILTPTRELAIQITGELAKLAPVLGITVLAAYGGQDVESQIRKLKNAAPHVVVATPGRLLDHLRRETVTLSSIRMLVLDEADQMLHMGFLSEVEAIIDQCSIKRQTMLFSATMPDAVKQLAARYMDVPQDIRIKSAAVTLDAIEQRVVITTDRNKQPLLLRLLETENPYLAVVFCRTKLRAKKLTEALQEAGVPADELHGDLTQAKREAVMKRFRSARLQVLVATDVAARGLDVEGVTHVFNYDAPADGDTYIHRIGRTGRAGESGKAITLATARDRASLEAVEQKIRASIKRIQGSEYGIGLEAGTERFDAEPRSPRTGGRSSGGRKAPAGGRGSSRPGSRDSGGGRSAGRSSAGGGRSGSRTEAAPSERAGRFAAKPAGRPGAGAASTSGAKPARSWTDESASSARPSARGRGPAQGRSAGASGRPAFPGHGFNPEGSGDSGTGRGNRRGAAGAGRGASGGSQGSRGASGAGRGSSSGTRGSSGSSGSARRGGKPGSSGPGRRGGR